MPVFCPDVQTSEVNEETSSSVTTSKSKKKIYLIAKRVVDVLLASVALALMMLPMGLIALLIKLESPGPVIYVHNRIGKNGVPIGVLKFRSMLINAEEMIESFSSEQKTEWEENFKLENTFIE